MQKIDIQNFSKYYLKNDGNATLARVGHVNSVIDTVNGKIDAPANPSLGDALVWNGTEWVAGNSAEFTYEIGEYVPSEGGVIFHRYLEAGVENYLVVPIVDESVNQNWSNITTLTGVSAQSTWDGLSNSDAIVAQIGHLNSAASLCLNSTTGGQNDWYLPSTDELSLLWQSRFHVNKSLSAIGGATLIGITGTTTSYWTSTENNPATAITFNFSTSGTDLSSKSNTFRVRAVRALTI
jgi:predicted ribosomally synthesized peptide with SipW-like signal peptide